MPNKHTVLQTMCTLPSSAYPRRNPGSNVNSVDEGSCRPIFHMVIPSTGQWGEICI